MSDTAATSAKALPQDITGAIEINGNTYQTVTIPLSRPLFLGGQSVAEVTMREPTAQDLMMADDEAAKAGGSFKRSAALLSLVIQLPTQEIGKLPAADFIALDRRLDRFLVSGR